MVNPNDYKYLYDSKTGLWGYEIGYEHEGQQVCRVFCKPIKGGRRGVYKTRTGTSRALEEFYDAKEDHDAGRAAQKMLDDVLTEIRRLK